MWTEFKWRWWSSPMQTRGLSTGMAIYKNYRFLMHCTRWVNLFRVLVGHATFSYYNVQPNYSIQKRIMTWVLVTNMVIVEWTEISSWQCFTFGSRVPVDDWTRWLHWLPIIMTIMQYFEMAWSVSTQWCDLMLWIKFTLPDNSKSTQPAQLRFHLHSLRADSSKVFLVLWALVNRKVIGKPLTLYNHFIWDFTLHV